MIELLKSVEAAWAATPENIKNFVISAAANVATALFGSRKGGEQKQRFEKAYLAGLKGLTVTLEEEHPGLVKPYLDQPKVRGLLLKILENRSIKDPVPQFMELAAELGIDATGDDFENFAEVVRTFQICFESQALEGADPLQWLIYFKIQSYFSEEIIEKPPADLPAMKRAYLTHLHDDFERITFKGYTKGKAISIPLIEIFTKPLFDIEDDPHKAQAFSSPEKHRELKVSAEQVQNHTINTLLQCRLAVVTGGPGAGKSTLLKYLALVLAARQLDNKDPDILPIIFPISAYAEKRRKAAGGTYTIKAFLSDYWQERFLDDPVPLFEAYWQQGRALFLIDGLDEVADEGERLKMISDVRYFIMATMKESQLVNRFYITCRSASYEGASQFEQIKRFEFKRFEIKRFDIDQIGHFLFSWYCWYERDFKNRYEYLRLAGECVLDMGRDNIFDSTFDDLTAGMWAVANDTTNLNQKATLAELAGRLGDTRADLEGFSHINGGCYDLEDIGEVELTQFEIGRYPVTNLSFSRFTKEGGYKNESLWSPHGRLWLQEKQVTRPRLSKNPKYNCPAAPVTGVSWYEADAFCQWLTAKDAEYRYFLPSQEQWQAAAAGKDKRKYPWGPKWKQGVCNTDESEIGRPSPVGIFAEGRTPKTHIYDMAGNVWEWTCTNHKPEEVVDDFLYDEDWKKQVEAGLPLIKGGAWSDPADGAACASRYSSFPADRSHDVGFRCARTKK